MISCNKCYSNEIEEQVWLDLVTGEVRDRSGEYYCRHCGSKVDIILTPDPTWIEGVEIFEEENEKESKYKGMDTGNSS